MKYIIFLLLSTSLTSRAGWTTLKNILLIFCNILDYLLTSPVDANEAYLPSPEDLAYKIIIKVNSNFTNRLTNRQLILSAPGFYIMFCIFLE